MSELKDEEEDDKENPVQFRIVLTGYSYQLKLLLLFLCRGLINGYIFKLQTEINEAEKFDDLIFYYKKSGERKFSAICLQAKHSTFKEAELEYSSFINHSKKKVCNLKKYFVSFRNIKRNFSAAERPQTYILCNNYFLPLTLKRNEKDKVEDALIFEKVNVLGHIFHDAAEIWPQHKLSQPNKELLDWLEKETNISFLAAEMSKLIIKTKPGEDCVEIDLNGYYFSVYRDALLRDGILEVQDIITFKQSFIDGSNSSGGKPYFQNLRKFFITEFTKVYCEWKELRHFRLSEAFLEIFKDGNKKDAAKNYSDNELNSFATDLMECIINEKSKKACIIVADYSTILKEIIQHQKQIVFSDNFLNNDFSNPNIKLFRETLLKNYVKSLTHHIQNITIQLEEQQTTSAKQKATESANNFSKLKTIFHSTSEESDVNVNEAESKLGTADSENSKELERIFKINKRELAIIFFYKKRISPNIVTEFQNKFNETILQYSGATTVKFADKIFSTPEKKERLYNFVQKFQEFYAIESLKCKSFAFIPPKNDEINKLSNQLLQDGILFEFDKCNSHFTETLFEYAFEFLADAENAFKVRSSFFEIKNYELPENIRELQEKIKKKILESAYETLKHSQIQIEDFQEVALALPENKDKKRIIFGKFADEIIELHFGKSSTNCNNLYIYNWENYRNKETKGYINALKNDIFNVAVDSGILTFKKVFFANKGLSPNNEIFLKQLNEKLERKLLDDLKAKQFHIKPDCMPLYCKTEKMEKLAKTLIEANNSKQNTNFDDETEHLISDLAGTVFVSTGEAHKVKLSKYFINDSKWSCEAEYFKEALKEKLEVQEFKSLKNWTVEYDNRKVSSKSSLTFFEAELFAADIKAAIKNPKTNEKYISRKPAFHTMAYILKGTVFEQREGSDNSVLYFKDSFFDEQKWSKCAKVFKDCLKKYLSGGSFDALEDFEIDIDGFPFCCDTLIEDGNIKDDINEFLQNLLITTTPGDNALLEIVDKELGNEFQLLNTNAFTAELFTKIIEWSKLVDGKPLTEIETKNFFSEIKSNISSLMSSGINSLYCEKLKKKNLRFENVNINWKNFLEDECNSKQFLILKSNLMKLTEIKVLQVLQNISTYSLLDSMIFQNLSALLLMEKFILQEVPRKTLTSAFSSNISQNLIVIVDDVIAQNVWHFYDFLKTINNIIFNNPHKKMILITYEKSEILKIMKKQVFNEKIIEEHDFNQFRDLTKKSQNRILKKKVCFQGKLIPLYKIVNSRKFYDNFMDDETMKKLLANKKLNIALPLNSFKGFDARFYHNRLIGFLKADKMFFEVVEKTKKVFYVFNGVNECNLRELLKQHGVEISKMCSASDFIKRSFNPKWRYVAFEKNTEEEIAAYLKQVKFKYPRAYVYSMLIVDTKAGCKMYVHEKLFVQYILNENVVAITDSAGMGKSTILTKLEHELKEINPQKWIIRINLSQHTPLFLKLKKDDKYPNNDDTFVFDFESFKGDYGEMVLQALRKSKKIVEAAKTLENHIFEYLFVAGKVLIIFDGFDEIGAEYRKILLSWILRLKNKSKNQIWITSRSQFLSTLEVSLKTTGYSLKPLTQNEQEKMLFNIWRNKWKGKSLTKSQEFHLLQYVKQLIYDFSQSLKTTQNIVESPLHTMMLAKMFKQNRNINDSTGDKVSNWVGCYDYIRQTSSCKKDNNLLFGHCLHYCDTGPLKNLFTLYDKFVERKIIKYFVEEKNIVGSVQEAALKIKKQILIDYHHIHCIFGLFAMTDAHHELLDEAEKEKIKTFTAEFKLGDYNAGLLDDVIEKECQPVFVHLNYAEYFCACFLIDKLNSAPEKKDVIFNIIGKVLKSNAAVFSYCIKHLMIHKCENYDIGNLLKDINVANFATTLEHYNCVKWLLNNDDNFEFKFPKVDSNSKTHLHYAVECGNRKIIIYVLLQTYTLIMKNDLQRHYSLLFKTHLPFEAKTTAMFYLSEYIKLKDNNGKTALYYSKDSDITALLNDIINVGQEQKTSNIYVDDIIKILDEISKMFVENDLSEILNGTVHSLNIFTAFFNKVSISSILTILDNVEPLFLKFLLNDDENGFNFLAIHFARKDLNPTEKVKVFESFEKAEFLPKEIIFGHFITAVISLDSIQDYRALTAIAANKNIQILLENSVALACQYGTYNILEMLLLPYLTNEIKIEDLTPICYAIKCGASLSMLQLIYQQTKPDINDKFGRGDTALTLAISTSFKLPIIRFLLQNGADSNIPGPEKYNKQDVINNFAELLKPVPVVNFQSDTQTPWDCAMIKKDDDIIKCFLENSVIIESEICLETMESFYQEPNFNINFKADKTPRLMEAIYLDDTNLIEFLLWKKADVNIEDKTTGKTALHYACEKNLHTLVKKLLKLGAFFDKEDNEGKLPIDYCDENSEATKSIEFVSMIFGKSEEEMKTFNESNVLNSHYFSFSLTNKKKQNLMHIFAKRGLPLELKKSDKHKINSQDFLGNTAIHYAAENGNINILTTLLLNNAFYDIENNDRKTPQMLAKENGHEDVSDLLKKLDEMFNSVSKNDINLFTKAAEDFHKASNNAFHEFKIHCLRNIEGKSLIYKAVTCKSIDVTRILLKYVYAPDIEDQNLLFLAIKYNDFAMIKLLLKHKIPFNNKRWINFKKDSIKNECVTLFENIKNIFDYIYNEDYQSLTKSLKCLESYELNFAEILNMFF